MGTPSSSIQAFAKAIAQEEGFNIEGSLPNTLANPGDLTDSQTGQLLDFNGNAQDGWQALYNQLGLIQSGQSSHYSPSETLQQFADTWTGGDTNAANNLSSILGVSKDTPLSSIFNGDQGGVGSSVSQALKSVSPSTSPLSFLSQLFGATTGADVTSPITSDYLVRGVAIAAGLILIAGAVFGFKSVHDTVIEAGTKLAKSGTEVAAVAV